MLIYSNLAMYADLCYSMAVNANAYQSLIPSLVWFTSQVNIAPCELLAIKSLLSAAGWSYMWSLLKLKTHSYSHHSFLHLRCCEFYHIVKRLFASANFSVRSIYISALTWQTSWLSPLHVMCNGLGQLVSRQICSNWYVMLERRVGRGVGWFIFVCPVASTLL